MQVPQQAGIPPMPDLSPPATGTPSAAGPPQVSPPPPTQGMDPMAAPQGAGPPTVDPSAQAGGPVAPGPPRKQSLEPGDPKKVEEDKHKLVVRAMEIMNSPKTRDIISDNLRKSQQQVKTVAETAQHIVHKIDTAAAKKNIDIDFQAKIEGGIEIIQEISEIAEAVGKPLQEDDKELAYSLAIQDYLKEEIRAGRIDKDELEKYAKDGLQNLDPEGMEAANEQMGRIDHAAMRVTGKLPPEESKPEPQAEPDMAGSPTVEEV